MIDLSIHRLDLPIMEAIDKGHETATAIANSIGVSTPTVNLRLKVLITKGCVDFEKVRREVVGGYRRGWTIERIFKLAESQRNVHGSAVTIKTDEPAKRDPLVSALFGEPTHGKVSTGTRTTEGLRDDSEIETGTEAKEKGAHTCGGAEACHCGEGCRRRKVNAAQEQCPQQGVDGD